ncbi:MAG: hypothetical protein ACREOZ_00360, partial [Gloeomargaritales cyanobacterium]
VIRVGNDSFADFQLEAWLLVMVEFAPLFVAPTTTAEMASCLELVATAADAPVVIASRNRIRIALLEVKSSKAAMMSDHEELEGKQSL